jgi:hypothetical protein
MTEILASFAKVIDGWSGRAAACDKKLARVYETDAAQLWKIHSLIRKGKCDEALNRAVMLDTIVRDLIPEAVWKLMESGKGEGDGRSE